MLWTNQQTKKEKGKFLYSTKTKEKKFKKKGQFFCPIYKKKGPKSNETMEIGHAYMTE